MLYQYVPLCGPLLATFGTSLCNPLHNTIIIVEKKKKEVLECLQYNWKGNIADWALVNSHSIEEVDVDFDDFFLILQDKEELYMGDYDDDFD